MDSNAQSGSEWTSLASALADWRSRWVGRSLFRAAAGPGWLRLHLNGDERPGLLLIHQPGIQAILAGRGRLPEPLHRALKPTPKHPLSTLLQDCTLVGLGVLPDDKVAALRFENPQGEKLVLLQQLFGARGNLTVLDAKTRLVWAAHRPPHSLLAEKPPQVTWNTGQADGEAVREVDTTPDDFAFGPHSIAALDRLAGQLAERRRQEIAAILQRTGSSADRLVANLERDLARAERGDEFRRKGETLAVHLHNLPAGSSNVTLIDPRDGAEVEIELDPARSPAANLESWFRRARKADKGREIIRERMLEAAEQAAVLTAARAQFSDRVEEQKTPLDLLATVQTWAEENAALLPASRKKRGGRPGVGPEEPARPFRRYLLDGRWEVWIGRNNKENDTLTFAASHGKDLWLHAQGVPGSHVILRTGGKPEQVPRGVLEKAAALAALHCRSKHSSLVPVVWTERRYVRKPRKAPPGAATCLREKSLFVEPGIPPGAEAI